MLYTVLVCERATGYVCHPDGRWWLTTDGPRRDPEFASLEAAEGWCRALRARRPDLECSIRDSSGQQVAVFR